MPLFGFDLTPSCDGETALDPLEGDWRLVKVMVGVTEVGFEPSHFSYHDGKVTTGAKAGVGESGGVYRFDRGRTPGRLVISFNEGRLAGTSWKVLTRHDGDILSLTFVSGAADWPPGLDGPNVIVATYRKEKK
jgi:hypothetical protein